VFEKEDVVVDDAALADEIAEKLVVTEVPAEGSDEELGFEILASRCPPVKLGAFEILG
jgi:hypothetical protein